VDIAFRLHDANDGTLIWSHAFERRQLAGVSLASEKEIVRRVAAMIAQPYGLIYTRELARSAETVDARYRCLLDSFEFYRSYNPSGRVRVRECVNQITKADPTFAGGQVALAFRFLHDHFDNADPDALDRAMVAALEAVSLDPASARAHQAMMNVLYARGDIALALAEGRKAVDLNPYDTTVLSSYGIRLLWSGDIKQAMTLLRESAEYNPGRLQFTYFALFAGAYSLGDDTAAAQYANLLASESYSYGLAARAIVAARAGQAELARRAVHKLVQLRPAWRE